jgi:hypothetical protein
MGRGQATVTSECAHTFHLRCFSGSVCPVCGARWRDVVTTVTPPSPLNNSSSPAQPRAPLFSTPTFTLALPKPNQPLFLAHFQDPIFHALIRAAQPLFLAATSLLVVAACRLQFRAVQSLYHAHIHDAPPLLLAANAILVLAF